MPIVVIDTADSGKTEIVAGVSGQTIRVKSAFWVVEGGVNSLTDVDFQESTSGDALTGVMTCGKFISHEMPADKEGNRSWFETSAGFGLTINLGAAEQVSGSLTYEID